MANKPKLDLDRAYTPEQKKEILNRVLAVWMSVPDLRLGQLLSNAVGVDNLFYKEDYVVISQIEDYLNSYASTNK